MPLVWLVRIRDARLTPIGLEDMKGSHTFTEFVSHPSEAADLHIGSSEENIFVAAERIGIFGQNPSVLKAIEQAGKYARWSVPVLILGKRGTGKELFARLIHELSGREKFVPYNSSGLTPELAGSELFGHLKGAFTGATARKMGLFDAADGGTLFLDEVAEIPITVQAKLLRVLEDGIVVPVGGTTGRKVNVRVLAATNKDLNQQIKDGLFREDLFDRLNVGRVSLPSLKDRKTDIKPLASKVLKDACVMGMRKKTISEEAFSKLHSYSWPGNVREFENVLTRSIIESEPKETIETDDLEITEMNKENDPFSFLPEPDENFSLKEYLDKIRNEIYRRTVKRANYNYAKAGKLLGVSAQAVHKQMKRIN